MTFNLNVSVQCFVQGREEVTESMSSDRSELITPEERERDGKEGG